MNSQAHRLIFNPARGCIMAVAETSRSCSKSGPSGTTPSKRTKCARCHQRADNTQSVRGQLILGTNTTQTAHTEKTETAGVWQEMKGNGQTTQTANQTLLKGNVNFDAALKITAQIPDTKGAQELKDQINALAASNPSGLAYLQQLATTPHVQWDKVALANKNWRYEQAGLTPAGASLLTVAVAYLTAGAGTAMVGTTTTTAATATTAAVTTTTVMGSTALATAVNAGFSALASQAAVAMANNGGDIGKTLDQLGKEESIKNLLLTMVTAGALDKLGATYFKGVDASSTFSQQLQKNLVNNVASDMMNSALAGKPFDEATLQKSLQSALITTGMAQTANAIGDARVDNTLNDFTHKVAHAVLGCAGGAATAGNASGCAPGAVGAVVGELTAEYASKNGMSKTDALGLAKVVAAASGLITGGGGDNAAAVNVAATTGANAAENNFLAHAKLLQRNDALKILRTNNSKNFLTELLLPSTGDVDGQKVGVLDAAKIAVALDYMDKRSDALLAVWRQSPNSLSVAEKNELAVYLSDYAKSEGTAAAQNLLRYGSGQKVDNADVPELMGLAKTYLRINEEHQGQAAIGTPALSVLSGGVGNLVRAVQVAQSSREIGIGIGNISDGNTADGAINIGLGLMGLIPNVAMQYSTSVRPALQELQAARAASGGGATGGVAARTNVGFDTANLQSKLEGYLLDPVHPQNQTKATWFQQALGFDKSNWQQLGSQISFNESTALATKTTQYGQTFEQVIPITGANGKTIDVSFVFMKDNTGTVRLVTGIPAKK